MSATVDPAATESKHHRCLRCDESIDERVTTFPFCSERCRMADLGRWFDGSYVISRGLKPEDLDELET
ncbi:MAG: DNA gyrase inhibitor YacG [Phycisphaerales bacterium JB043]